MSTTNPLSPGHALKQQFRARWHGLTPRDRVALQVLLAFVVALGFWFGAWMPVHRALQAARDNVAAEQQLQAYLRANAPRLAASAQVAGTLTPAQVPALLASSADKHGVVVVQAQQRPDQRYAVALEGPPANVMAWLEALQGAGVAVSELTVAQMPDGNWDSDVVLSGP